MDNKNYTEALKQLVNLQFQYAISQMGNSFLVQIQKILEENNVLSTELGKIVGTVAFPVTVEEVRKGKLQFELQIKQLQEQEIPVFLEYVLEMFGANSFEKHCIRLLFAFELDKTYRNPAALLQDSWEYGFVTPYLAQITYEEAVDSFFVHQSFAKGSLLQRFFVEREGNDHITLLNKVVLKARILDFAMGNVAPDWKYLRILQKRNYEQELEPWFGAVDDSTAFIYDSLDRKREMTPGIIYIYGEEGCGKKFSVFHACQRRKENCMVIDLEEYEKKVQFFHDAEEQNLIDGIICELILFQAIPVVTIRTTQKEKIGQLVKDCRIFLKQLIKTFSLVFLCAVEKVQIEENMDVTYLHKGPMSLLEGKLFWETVTKRYAMEENVCIGDMANKFRLTQGKIVGILEQAEKRRIQKDTPCISKEMLQEECYEAIAQSMGTKAIKVPANYTMEDLILPEKQKQQLTDACNQVKFKHKIYEEWGFEKKISYGKGVSMAFVGSPGTGKTMAAQVIARELGMELYKVELSSVVSKYVGETEKNLNEIFEQAKKSQVILFFDEADVLFSKRTEGKETNDKYSNMEAAFLLQKMEVYEGITILATNLFHHFDEAFKRRLKIIVDFPVPNEKDRKQLWKSMIPKEMEVGEIDFDYLAKQFPLTGSNIRNILLHSAFLAASKGKAVDMEEIIPSIKNEYAKNGKTLLKEDVSEYYMYLQ